MNRVSWVLVATLFGAAVACGPVAPPKQAAGPRLSDEAAGVGADGQPAGGDSSGGAEVAAPTGEEAQGMKAKVNARIAPYRWGMTLTQVFDALDSQLDEDYADRIEKVPAGNAQVRLEQERDKKKANNRTKKVEFTGGSVSGYEIKTPGEFTYRNNESALEVTRPGGGERVLFFIGDKLWKIYDIVPVAEKGELGPSYLSAIKGLNDELGAKGDLIPSGKPSASYYGSLASIPARVVWFDGTTQIRLVDNTAREDATVKFVAVVYEDGKTLTQLTTLRANVEKKDTNASVDAAAAVPAAKDDKKKDDKKKK